MDRMVQVKLRNALFYLRYIGEGNYYLLVILKAVGRVHTKIVAKTPKNSVIPDLIRELGNGESITEIPNQVRDDAEG